MRAILAPVQPTLTFRTGTQTFGIGSQRGATGLERATGGRGTAWTNDTGGSRRAGIDGESVGGEREEELDTGVQRCLRDAQKGQEPKGKGWICHQVTGPHEICMSSSSSIYVFPHPGALWGDSA